MKLYRHLAWDGIRKNSRLYVPYLLTGVGAVSFFYILVALARLPEGTLPGSGSVQVILNLGSFVLWVFSLLLFYTHSFLIRRRNREFALYNVLGMGKGDISRILCWESLLSGGLSLLGGLALGVVLSKLAELGLMRVMGLEADMTYRVSAGGLLMALGLYGAIYLLILLSALLRVRRSTAIQLMRSEAVGEKPPRANWALALLGVLLLGAAYYLAVSIREPLTALTWFFAAVLKLTAATRTPFTPSASTVFTRPTAAFLTSPMILLLPHPDPILPDLSITSTISVVFVMVPMLDFGGLRVKLMSYWPSSPATGIAVFSSSPSLSSGDTKKLPVPDCSVSPTIEPK